MRTCLRNVRIKNNILKIHESKAAVNVLSVFGALNTLNWARGQGGRLGPLVGPGGGFWELPKMIFCV